jgi:phosphatidylglycerophosphate synthase
VWLVAGVLVLAFGVFDLFDGALARATNRVSRFGAFLDSTLDRAGEAMTYLGIGYGLAMAFVVDGFLLATAAMAAAFMVSYTRAKAESLGFSSAGAMSTVGLMPREVRIVALTLGLIGAGSLGGADTGSCATCAGGATIALGIVVLEAALGLIVIGATVTAIQRILVVHAQAKEG